MDSSFLSIHIFDVFFSKNLQVAKIFIIFATY